MTSATTIARAHYEPELLGPERLRVAALDPPALSSAAFAADDPGSLERCFAELPAPIDVT